MKDYRDYCTCDDCLDSDRPCTQDCDRDAECEGCRELNLELEEVQFEIDCAMGRI